jgi:hypothetical protein
MRSQVTKIALAVTLATALIDAAPASAQHGKYSLALATGHELPWPTATHAQTKQNYNYYRESGYQWDPWGHWGSYYGPMIH